MSQRASIKDVAALAGVSFKTVSRVVNGVDTVLPELRTRVEAAVAELNYVPNSAARSLKSGSGTTIGIVVDSIDDIFFASLVRAIEERALEHGMGVMVSSTGFDPERELAQLTRMAGQHVRGIVLAPVGDHSDFLTPRRRSLPVVTVDRSVSGFDSVTVDDYAGAHQAVTLLVDAGHSRIALVGYDPRLQTARRRRDAYVDLLIERGLPVDDVFAPEVPPSPDAVRPVVRDLLALADPPTALFVSNARHASAVVSVLHEMARTDVAMVSFGSFALADAVQPAVTCIDQNPYEIGSLAFDRLLLRFDDPTLDTVAGIADTTLITRTSHLFDRKQQRP